MIPVVTPDEMAAVDAAAPEPVEVLIGRAGAATARAAVRLLGGTYGRRVIVIAGKGNNGNDGRDAAGRLRRRGVRVTVVPAAEAPAVLPPADLVIDAAYGTGFRGEYRPPACSSPVLAVDIPSGVDGLTGTVSGTPWSAQATVTFAALKPGLLFHPGRALAGEVSVADIGLDVTSARSGLVTGDDVATWLPHRSAVAHKWQAAVQLVAGSPGMSGAAALTAAAAQRAGAGMVRHVVPPGGTDVGGPVVPMPVETVTVHPDPADDLTFVADDRLHAVVVGPGTSADDHTAGWLRELVARVPGDRGLLIDGGALTALGIDGTDRLAAAGRAVPAVLTPHDGEYTRLAGAPPGPDRCAAARRLARGAASVVVLKGPATVVAHPDGRVRIVTSGDARLATAGTGDVLAGVIGALLARGVDPFDAAAAGAWLHGEASRLGPAVGLVASDIVSRLPVVLNPPGRRGEHVIENGTGTGSIPVHRGDGG